MALPDGDGAAQRGLDTVTPGGGVLHNRLLRQRLRHFLAPLRVMMPQGHSTIVALACVAIAAASLVFGDKMDRLHSYGSTIDTLVSALFLLMMALLNTLILRDVWRRF